MCVILAQLPLYNKMSMKPDNLLNITILHRGCTLNCMGVICQKQRVHVNHIHTLCEQISFHLLFTNCMKETADSVSFSTKTSVCCRLLDFCLELGTILPTAVRVVAKRTN